MLLSGTPVLLKYPNGTLCVVEVQHIAPNNLYRTETADVSRTGICVFTDAGFMPLNRIRRSIREHVMSVVMTRSALTIVSAERARVTDNRGISVSVGDAATCTKALHHLTPELFAYLREHTSPKSLSSLSSLSSSSSSMYQTLYNALNYWDVTVVEELLHRMRSPNDCTRLTIELCNLVWALYVYLLIMKCGQCPVVTTLIRSNAVYIQISVRDQDRATSSCVDYIHRDIWHVQHTFASQDKLFPQTRCHCAVYTLELHSRPDCAGFMAGVGSILLQ